MPFNKAHCAKGECERQMLRDALEQIRKRATANANDDLKEMQRQAAHIESIAKSALGGQ